MISPLEVTTAYNLMIGLAIAGIIWWHNRNKHK
jgi:hypothetical protein